MVVEVVSSVHCDGAVVMYGHYGMVGRYGLHDMVTVISVHPDMALDMAGHHNALLHDCRNVWPEMGISAHMAHYALSHSDSLGSLSDRVDDSGHTV